MLLSLVLRNTFDVYRMLSMIILFGFCILQWLVNKRSEFIVSRGTREVAPHLKMLLLSSVLTTVCFVVSYVFYKEFINDQEVFETTGEERLGKVYVIIGFEFIRLCLKGLKHNMRY